MGTEQHSRSLLLKGTHGWYSANHHQERKKKAAPSYDPGRKEWTCLVHASFFFFKQMEYFQTYDLHFSKIPLYFGIKQFVEMEVLSKADTHCTPDGPKDFYLLKDRTRCFKVKKMHKLSRKSVVFFFF